MYLPPHFEEARRSELFDLIERHPLGALVMQTPAGLDANHLPFLLEKTSGDTARLVGHVARANPLWQGGVQGREVLVIFRGEEAYVSPNWYPTKHEAHRQVPTWNYQVVHVHGRLHVHDDAQHVRHVVARLTRLHEQRTGDEPWKMSDAPKDYLDAIVANIVAIEVDIARIEGKFKLSQNRDDRDREGAADELRRRGQAPLADAMTRRDRRPR